MTNLEIAAFLREVAAAYQILGENRFKIIAYERAADSIEHLTSEVKDLWDDGKLGDIPGVGTAITGHLDELFRTGKVSYLEAIMEKVPQAVFPLLRVPGLGPKKAYRLVTELGLTNPKTVIEDLRKAASDHKIAVLEGFGEKSEADIVGNIALHDQGQIKENRMVLPEADAIAGELMAHMKKHTDVKRIDVLGSLRRHVSTIGDIDMSVATTKPETVLTHFLQFPHKKIIEKGPTGASVLLNNGRQIDLRVQKSDGYGAMLQYFTGSKNHNIKLRSYALEHGMSLNEYGIKSVKTGKLTKFSNEEDFYRALRMPWIPPELREDRGEIEAALKGKLPRVVSPADMRGDLHIHTSYDLEPSHDLGANTITEYLNKAEFLGYEYIGLSDHNPSVSQHSEDQIISIMKRRKEYYEQQWCSWIKKASKRVHIVIMCEVDILADGKIALPSKAFDYVDAVIVSIHSGFQQDRKQMTERVVNAITQHPKIKVFGHPTARLLGKREGIELDWDAVFTVCKEKGAALEINASPQRLDLPDSIVFDAVKAEIPLVIDTDSHAVDQMDLMRYGVSVARRGWAQERDIVNTLSYNDFIHFIGTKEVVC